MTAEDVKYSFERVLDPEEEVARSTATSARSRKSASSPRIPIQLVTDKPFPLLLERLVFFPIVPKKHIEKVGDQAFGDERARRHRAVEVRGVEA